MSFREGQVIHYIGQTIEIVVLQAMMAHRQGHSDQALILLQEALDLARPGVRYVPSSSSVPP